MDGAWPIVGAIAAAWITQTGAVLVAIVRSGRGTRDLLAELRKDLAVLKAEAVTRTDCDTRMQVARSDWSVQCERHKERCEDDRKSLRLSLTRLAARLNGGGSGDDGSS
jgi:hypothetical protein